MKKIALLFSFLPLWAMAENPFVLTGKVNNLKTGQKIYLVRNGKVSDSAIVQNKVFIFKGMVKEPELASLRSSDNTEKTDGLSFYLDKGNIQIESRDKLTNAEIKGSKINEENNQLEAAAGTLDDAKACLNFASAHPDSYISLVALERMCKDPEYLNDVKKVYDGLSEQLKKTEKGTILPALFGVGDVGIEIGAMAKDFTMNDVNGKAVKLSDYKGKYVLLDFWASWCGPCRGENPNLLSNYLRYKDKGFDVLGVSLDESDKKSAWLKAVKDDDLPWKQVSDLKGWRNKAARAYNVSAIPQNFLINPSGRIVAIGLRGEKLTEKMEEIFNGKKVADHGPNIIFVMLLGLIPFLILCTLTFILLNFVKSRRLA